MERGFMACEQHMLKEVLVNIQEQHLNQTQQFCFQWFGHCLIPSLCCTSLARIYQDLEQTGHTHLYAQVKEYLRETIGKLGTSENNLEQNPKEVPSHPTDDFKPLFEPII